MSATVQALFAEDEAAETASVQVDADQQEAQWRHCWRNEHYVRPGRDFEDYAPAYCVGTIGHAQYGGSYEDAEKSLCANWVRIRGDSKLEWDEALAAIRAAWDRMAAGPQAASHWRPFPAGLPAHQPKQAYRAAMSA